MGKTLKMKQLYLKEKILPIDRRTYGTSGLTSFLGYRMCSRMHCVENYRKRVITKISIIKILCLLHN